MSTELPENLDMANHPVPAGTSPTNDKTDIRQAKISTATFHPDEVANTMIGPYKLLQQLGKGGMGLVWMAEQTEPVKRRVAVKIIKADLRGDQVLARFEAERQALALMDHPNIARVFDAGTTFTGRSYFVMELVKGIPFTEYCDQEHLTPKERLELFIPVCHAVQHAHQRGIIHRDLKPSNVLVAVYDGKPVPKIIDFGIAKAMHQKLSERTIYTEVGMMVGTLEYMAPEQAELNNLDIDTRADIYSLGVMLYEVLTGELPFSADQLRGEAFLEMLRLIRDVEPSRPSTRLATSKELPSIAAKRKLKPNKLSQLVRGDLDWIVMKCLEKERGQRYETAAQLALELQRFLADEPVKARPPSLGYRLKKFVRRHPELKTWGSAFVLLQALLAGVLFFFLGRNAYLDNRPLAEGEDEGTERKVEPAKRPRLAIHDLYVLSVGISKYKDDSGEFPDLPTAQNDAYAVVDAFKKLEGSLCKKVVSKVLANEEATRDGIRFALFEHGWLRSHRLDANSLVIITFSGRGFLHDDHYYFAPHDYNPERRPQSTTGIFLSELQSYTDYLPCPVILVFDTSHSGAARIEKPRNKGLVVIAACAGNQEATGKVSWGHGTLTLALLEGIEGKYRFTPKDVNSLPIIPLPKPGDDGFVTFDELDRYITKRVETLSMEMSNPEYRSQKARTSWNGDISLEQIPISVKSRGG